MLERKVLCRVELRLLEELDAWGGGALVLERLRQREAHRHRRRLDIVPNIARLEEQLRIVAPIVP